MTVGFRGGARASPTCMHSGPCCARTSSIATRFYGARRWCHPGVAKPKRVPLPECRDGRPGSVVAGGSSIYNRSERSISYYNKGELLGYLLDLGMRHASQNRAGLDDVMRRLNQDFARRGRFYTLADLSSIIAQLAPQVRHQLILADDAAGKGYPITPPI